MRSGSVVAAVILAMAVAAIALTRPPLARTAREVKARSDVYALPPTEFLPALSMGYRAALADLLWSEVLVTQGLRMQQRRPFEFLVHYLDAIHALDPHYRDPYRFADSLLSFQANDLNKEHNVRAARRILERGLKEHPYDAELWLNYGQFIAYIASGILKDPEERDAWRAVGGQALVRAGELGSNDTNLMMKSMSGAAILAKGDQRDAAIRFLERAYTITEDEEAREEMAAKLGGLLRDRMHSTAMRLDRASNELWREEIPYYPRVYLTLIGPPVNPWKCTGPQRAEEDRLACSRAWPDWSRSVLGGPVE